MGRHANNYSRKPQDGTGAAHGPAIIQLPVWMPLFQDLAEIFANLPPRRPRRGQPDDQQRSDAHSSQQRGHSPATRNSSHSRDRRPSHDIRSPRRWYSPEPQLADADLALSRLPTNRDTAARLQVCDIPIQLFAPLP